MALLCSHIDDYLKCHHVTFIQQLMETGAKIHSIALGGAPKVQSKSGRRENTSKEVKIGIGTTTKIAYLSKWEPTNSVQIAKEPAQD